MTRAEGLDEER